MKTLNKVPSSKIIKQRSKTLCSGCHSQVSGHKSAGAPCPNCDGRFAFYRSHHLHQKS